MKPLTILLLIISLSLVTYRYYDWWVCTRIDRKRNKKRKFIITDRSNVIQYDSMGYPLRLVILDDKEQIWLDSYEEEGDVVLKWKGTQE